MTRPDVHPDDMFDDDSTIAAFARALRSAAASTPPPAIGPALEAVLAGRAPAATYDERVPTRGRDVGRRRVAIRLAIGGAVAAAVTGTLGSAGALPTPVQRQVARMAEVVGLELPDGDDSGAPAPVDPTTTTTTPVTTTTVVPTTAATVSVPTTTPVTHDDDDRPDNGNGNGNGNGNSNGGRGNGRDDEPDDRDRPDDDRGDSSGRGSGRSGERGTSGHGGSDDRPTTKTDGHHEDD